jgi:hypothetical protein
VVLQYTDDRLKRVAKEDIFIISSLSFQNNTVFLSLSFMQTKVNSKVINLINIVMEQYENFNNVMYAGDNFKNPAGSNSQMSRENFLKKVVLCLKVIRIMGMFLLFSVNLSAQGLNNNFDYDKEDFNVIFKELGITTFKFPVKQSVNQIFNIVIEEYEDKKLMNSVSVIDDMKGELEKIGMDAISYFKPKADSIYFHRFYFIEKDSTLKVRIKSHGIELSKEFSLSGKSTFSFSAFDIFTLENNSCLEIDKPEILVYLYANSSNEKDKPLWCPSGLSKEQLLERFYYLIFISIEPYSAK